MGECYRGSPETNVIVGSEGECAISVPVRNPGLSVGTGRQITNFYTGVSHGYWFSLLMSCEL